MEEQEQAMVSLQKLALQEKEKNTATEEQLGTESVTESLPNLDEVEEIIRYKFKNKVLLNQAFTHSSFIGDDDCSSYERLEYVGDSVLNLLIDKEHYFRYPDILPGELTRLRAANVDTEKLARVALKHNLYRYLRHRKPLLEGLQIKKFMAGVAKYPLHSNGLIGAPKVLADIVESTVGAIFIDSNSSMDATWEVVKDLVQPLITLETLQLHPVTKLHELCQKNGLKMKLVDLWSKTGEIEVYIDNVFVGRKKYKRKKLIAINRVAEHAYNYLVDKLVSKDGIGI